MLTLGALALALSVNVGTFKEGHDVGKRNGGLIAERVYKRTMLTEEGRLDCAGLGLLQQTLNTVAAKARPPRGSSSRFTAGFYSGYVDAIRESVKGARDECRALRFGRGVYPGEFFANVFCQVAQVDEAALAEMTFTSLYDGWSDSQEVRDECAATFQAVTAECAGVTGIAAQLLGVAQTAACSDL